MPTFRGTSLQLLMETTAVSFQELALYFPEGFKHRLKTSAFNKQISAHFSVFVINNGKSYFFVNMYQLSFDYPHIDTLLNIPIVPKKCGEKRTEKSTKAQNVGREVANPSFQSIPDLLK